RQAGGPPVRSGPFGRAELVAGADGAGRASRRAPLDPRRRRHVDPGRDRGARGERRRGRARAQAPPHRLSPGGARRATHRHPDGDRLLLLPARPRAAARPQGCPPMSLPAELVRRLNVAAPRYTSYPTVPTWTQAFGAREHAAAL